MFKSHVEIARKARTDSTNKSYMSYVDEYKEFLRKRGRRVDEVNESIPELICDFIKIRTRNFKLRVSTGRKCRKAIRAFYNDLGYFSEWREVRSIRNEAQSTHVEGNPAASPKRTQFLKDYKTFSQKAHGDENTADPIRYENIAAMFNEFIGTPTDNPLDDAEKIEHIRSWASCVIGASLLTRFDELSNLRVENLEFFEEDLTKVRILLPGGRKCNRGKRVSYILTEWPTLNDMRINPLCALSRWLRLRGFTRGFFFCEIENDGRLIVESKCNSTKLMEHVQGMLKKVGVLDVKRITSHSLRRGGAQLYNKLGLSLDWIMNKGGWKDYEAMQRYLELNNKDVKMEFQSAMALDYCNSLAKLRTQDMILSNLKRLLMSPAPNVTDEYYRQVVAPGNLKIT